MPVYRLAFLRLSTSFRRHGLNQRHSDVQLRVAGNLEFAMDNNYFVSRSNWIGNGELLGFSESRQRGPQRNADRRRTGGHNQTKRQLKVFWNAPPLPKRFACEISAALWIFQSVEDESLLLSGINEVPNPKSRRCFILVRFQLRAAHSK